MNIVAKEYIAAQDPEDPGVLILSRFAGAAVECKRALLVNPYDPDSVAAAITRALEMPQAERLERHGASFDALTQNPIIRWSTNFLHSLEPSAGVAAIPLEPKALRNLGTGA